MNAPPSFQPNPGRRRSSIVLFSLVLYGTLRAIRKNWDKKIIVQIFGVKYAAYPAKPINEETNSCNELVEFEKFRFSDFPPFTFLALYISCSNDIYLNEIYS